MGNYSVKVIKYFVSLVHRFLLESCTKKKYKFIIKDWLELTDLHACKSVLETKRFSQNMRPVQLDIPNAKTMLVIAPHPDDDILGAGGVILKAISNGIHVDIVYITNGSNNPKQASLIKLETQAICRKLGAKAYFLDCDVGKIPLSDSHVSNLLVSLVKENNPDILFVTFLLDDHDDHRRINHLLLKLYQNKVLDWRGEVWAYQVYSSILPNVVVDITDVSSEKLKLIRMWQSVSGGRDWAHYIKGVNAANCRFISTKDKVYVESFFVLPFVEYMSLCELYFSSSNQKLYYGKYYRNID